MGVLSLSSAGSYLPGAWLLHSLPVACPPLLPEADQGFSPPRSPLWVDGGGDPPRASQPQKVGSCFPGFYQFHGSVKLTRLPGSTWGACRGGFSPHLAVGVGWGGAGQGATQLSRGEPAVKLTRQPTPDVRNAVSIRTLRHPNYTDISLHLSWRRSYVVSAVGTYISGRKVAA